MSKPTIVRTYENKLLDKIFREERKSVKTITKTGLLDQMIKDEAERRGLK